MENKSCSYNGTNYSHGSTICSNNSELVCNNGNWEPTGKVCSTELQISKNEELNEEQMNILLKKYSDKKLQECGLSYEGMCGFAGSGSVCKVFNTSRTTYHRVLVDRIYNGVSQGGQYFNVPPFNSTTVGCTRSSYQPVATIDYAIIKVE